MGEPAGVNVDTERLDILLNRYFDGELTPAEKRELELMLLAEPRARREFWRAAALHGALRGNRQSSTCPEQPPSDSAVKVEATQEHDLDGRSHNWAAGR
ncbi:MAG: hypothetical protein EXS37_16415 [Opitutus sp.]|nr:hypothetical protein [Opitutus sp.]